MAAIKQHKVVASLPATLEADSIYFVRAGAGFDLYVTNSTGLVVAYQLNIVLPDSGVAAGTYPKVTVNGKGIVTAGEALQETDIPDLDASKIVSGTLTRNTSGNAATAGRLLTARTIGLENDVTGSVSFDGSGNVSIFATLVYKANVTATFVNSWAGHPDTNNTAAYRLCGKTVIMRGNAKHAYPVVNEQLMFMLAGGNRPVRDQYFVVPMFATGGTLNASALIRVQTSGNVYFVAPIGDVSSGNTEYYVNFSPVRFETT